MQIFLICISCNKKGDIKTCLNSAFVEHNMLIKKNDSTKHRKPSFGACAY